MFSLMWIFGIVVLRGAGLGHAQLPHKGSNFTTCEEFERGARFNPYEVIDSMWKIFYFWADTTELSPIVFDLASKKRVFKFREEVEAIDSELDAEWSKATLFMKPRRGTEVLLLYQGTPGAFRAIVKKEQRNVKERPFPSPLIKLADVRFKMVGEYIGMMCCEDFTAYALAKINKVPETDYKCVVAASKFGYKGLKGRSYIDLKREFDEL